MPAIAAPQGGPREAEDWVAPATPPEPDDAWDAAPPWEAEPVPQSTPNGSPARPARSPASIAAPPPPDPATVRVASTPPSWSDEDDDFTPSGDGETPSHVVGPPLVAKLLGGTVIDEVTTDMEG